MMEVRIAGVLTRRRAPGLYFPPSTGQKTRYGAGNAILAGILKRLRAGGEGSGCHGDHCGRPSTGAGQVPAKQIALPLEPSMRLTPSKERAWNGKQVETKVKLSKLETGKIGEEAVLAHLHQAGFTDARPLNEKHTNFPVDMVQDHGAIEVKAGLVSNGKSAQKWRATIGQPGKAETEWLKTASKEEKREWNSKKADAIMDRKKAAVKELSDELGVRVKGYTMTTLINPDTKTVDIFKFSGFHHSIPWSDAKVAKAYVGSYKYQ